MQQDKASDEDIILPESEIIIDGETITVNEISYVQGMKLHTAISPMIDDMANVFTTEDADFGSMSNVFARHYDIVNEMIMITTGKDENWLLGLSDEDGQTVLMTFWLANSGFFTRRLVTKSLLKMQAKNQPAAPLMAKSLVN